MERLSKADDQRVLSLAKKLKAIRRLGGKCKKCGCTDVLCLDFHHIDNKEFVISRKRNSRFSILEKEQDKCDLLCGNCHAEEHSTKTGVNFICKDLLIRSKSIKERKCIKCGYDKSIAALEFHHARGEKKFGIHTALVRQIKTTVEEFMEELEKCDLVCRNCHRKIHQEERYNRLKEHIEKRILTHKEIQPAIDRNRVKSMLESGMRPIQISRELKCTKSTISYIMKQLGITVPHWNLKAKQT